MAADPFTVQCHSLRIVQPGHPVKSPLDNPVLIATITLLPSAESGNANPVFSGWRPLLRYAGDDPDIYHGTEIRFDAVSKIAPEETARCIVRLLHPEHHGDSAQPAQRFVLMDGLSVRATGIVTDVYGFEDRSPA